MPKSSKHKKEKAADFSKAKLKLGKGKQTPNNAVDTSFKARSITLPSQNIVAEKDGLGPTTKRKLTFDDLMVHLKHYNAGTRKDALLGLRELFEDHPEILQPSLTTLLNGCVRLISDEDASVRKGLLSFFSWLLQRIPRNDLVPHAQILLLFTTSAQTHIFPEIRIDAIRFLDLYLEVIPEIVVEGWAAGANGHGRRVLEGYLGVLNAGTAYGESGDRGSIQPTSTASVILSPASKLVVLNSLLAFLSTALSRWSISSPVRDPFSGSAAQESPYSLFMTSSFRSPEAFSSFGALLEPRATEQKVADERLWEESANNEYSENTLIASQFALEGIDNSWSVGNIIDQESLSLSAGDKAPESSHGIRPETAYVVHLLRILHPILTATFLDYAPTVFSPSSAPPDVELRTVVAIAGIAQCLYGSVLPSLHAVSDDTLLENLHNLINHMTVYFPFRGYWSVATKRDAKVEQALQDLNLVYCELTSYLLLNGKANEASSRPSKKRRITSVATSSISRTQTDHVCQYVVRALRGEAVGQPGNGSALLRPISATSYISVLPTVWALLNHSDSTYVDETLRAVLEHATKSSSTSAVKRHTIEFLGRLSLLETQPEYCGRFRLSSLPHLRKNFEDWLIQLPKTMWELGSQNLGCTEIIIRLLLRLIQRRSSALPHETSVAISARIMPYFVIDHRTHGKVPGPFNKLPQQSSVRRLTLDLAYHFRGSSSCAGFEDAVNEGCSDTDREYWASIRSRGYY